ncbi:MAG: hypothetical protein JO263_07525, partial [Candidatus Eremiobacteraeota bacterium]|nr:hypothetical protein [Candidatus Eremiobacteraeota bacterium]
GFRVPLIVVSQYAKTGHISHSQHEFGSILKFTEENFTLRSNASEQSIRRAISCINVPSGV